MKANPNVSPIRDSIIARMNASQIEMMKCSRKGEFLGVASTVKRQIHPLHASRLFAKDASKRVSLKVANHPRNNYGLYNEQSLPFLPPASHPPSTPSLSPIHVVVTKKVDTP